MTRKPDIDRLLRVNAEQELPALRNHYATRTAPDSRDAIVGKIKSILEHQRSVLDYAIHDIVESLKITPDNPRFLLFPYVHPGKTPKPPTSNLLDQIQVSCVAVFNVLANIQSVAWLSELIYAVNLQKHDRPDRLGRRVLVSRPAGGGGVSGGDFGHGLVALPGSKLSIHGDGPTPNNFIRRTAVGGGPVDQSGVVRVVGGSAEIHNADIGGNVADSVSVGPGKPFDESAAKVFDVVDQIDDPNFEAKWIDRLEDWNSRVFNLIDDIYKALPPMPVF